MLLHEGLLPQSAFVRAPKAMDWPWMYVATRAGTLAVYKLSSVQGPEGGCGLFRALQGLVRWPFDAFWCSEGPVLGPQVRSLRPRCSGSCTSAGR